MIEGVVNADYEPVVRIEVRGPADVSLEIDAVVDTGYNGYLTLPPSVVKEIGLHYVSSDPAFLADGSEIIFDVYSVIVDLGDRSLQVDAHIANATPLIGMRLLRQHDLNIQVIEGGRVAIQPIDHERA